MLVIRIIQNQGVSKMSSNRRQITNGRRFSRRQVLLGLGIGTGGLFLAACAPQASPTVALPATAAPATEAAATAVPATATPAAKETVSISYQLPAHEQAFFDAQFAKFNQAQDDVFITGQFTPLGGDYEQKMTTLVAGGELGDGYWTAPFHIHYPFVARGIALDQMPFIEADNFDLTLFWPAAIAQLNTKGKQVGLPMSAHAGFTLLYVNLEIFKEVGIDTPTWEWTYTDQWLEATKALTAEKNGTIDRYGFLMNYTAQQVYTFIRSWGSDWVDPETQTKSLIDSDETIEAMMFIHDLVHKHRVSQTQADTIPDMFYNRLAVSFCGNNAGIPTLKDKAQFEWQAFPMPAGAGGRLAFIGPDTLCINSASKNPEAVWSVHKWLLGRESQLDQIATPGMVVPARIDLWDEKLSGDPNYDAARRVLEVAQPGNFPANARVSEFLTAFTQGFQGFMLETANPQQKLAELNPIIQEILDQPSL
jgi:multiple sugar transport system substrate-binding protein